MPLKAYPLVVFVYKVHEYVWKLLIFVEFNAKRVLREPSCKATFISNFLCDGSFSKISTNSDIHGVVLKLRRQVHSEFKINFDSIINVRPRACHSEIAFIFFWMFGVFLDRIILLLDGGFD